MKTNVDTKIEMDLSSEPSVSEKFDLILSILLRELETIFRRCEINLPKKSVGCKIDAELHSKLRDCAWSNKETVSKMLTRFIKEGLNRELSIDREP